MERGFVENVAKRGGARIVSEAEEEDDEEEITAVRAAQAAPLQTSVQIRLRVGPVWKYS
jgi:hypothetical protein